MMQMEKKKQENKMRRDQLNDEYLELLDKQRLYFKTVKDFKEVRTQQILARLLALTPMTTGLKRFLLDWFVPPLCFRSVARTRCCCPSCEPKEPRSAAPPAGRLPSVEALAVSGPFPCKAALNIPAGGRLIGSEGGLHLHHDANTAGHLTPSQMISA